MPESSVPEYAVPRRPRGRGRPRGGSTDTRDRILEAAVEEFAELGYDGATIRGIAGRAGVDAALVHHYFGTKADLFTEIIGAPMRPDVQLPIILGGPRDEVGERIVRYVLEQWEIADVRKRGTVLLRTAIGNKLATPLLSAFLAREMIGRIAASLHSTSSEGKKEAELRASLVGSQIAGLLIGRYVLKLPALASASVDELVDRIAPNVQHYLTG